MRPWGRIPPGVVARFFTGERGEAVVGAYLYPLRNFASPTTDADEETLTEVIATIQGWAQEVLMTRNAGLFLRIPAEIADHIRPGGQESIDYWKRQVAFQNEAARIFNVVLAELAMRGEVSQPVSPTYVSYGRLVEGHALVTHAGGAGLIDPDRQLAGLMSVAVNRWPSHGDTAIAGLDVKRVGLPLADLGASLPTLLTGAFYFYANRDFAEAVADAWIVTERLLASWWSRFLTALPDMERRRRLSDERTYSAAVRTELLHTAGELGDDGYLRLSQARSARNGLLQSSRQ